MTGSFISSSYPSMRSFKYSNFLPATNTSRISFTGTHLSEALFSTGVLTMPKSMRPSQRWRIVSGVGAFVTVTRIPG